MDRSVDPKRLIANILVILSVTACVYVAVQNVGAVIFPSVSDDARDYSWIAIDLMLMVVVLLSILDGLSAQDALEFASKCLKNNPHSRI